MNLSHLIISAAPWQMITSPSIPYGLSGKSYYLLSLMQRARRAIPVVLQIKLGMLEDRNDIRLVQRGFVVVD